MPLVSVIIPAHNSAAYIGQTLQSVLAQSITDIEVLVVDDGSTDTTASIIKEIALRDQRVHYIHQVNQGVAVSRNTAMKQASGEFIAFIDSDDIWLPDHLKDVLEVMNDDKSIGLAHANITTMNLAGESIETLKRNVKLLSGHIFMPLLMRDEHIVCSTVVIRKLCVDKLGFFDEALTWWSSEDRDLWLRISREFKIAYLDRATTLYRINPSGLSYKFDNLLKARLYVIDKLFKQAVIDDKLRNKVIARAYRDVALNYARQRNFRKTITNYSIALRYDITVLVFIKQFIGEYRKAS